MRRIHRDALGDSVPAVDPPAQLRQALGELERRSGKYAPGDFLPLLAAFSERALKPPGDRERIQHLSYEGSTLTLVLQPADPKRVAGAAGSGLDVRAEEAQWEGKPALRVRVRDAGGKWASPKP